MRCSARSAENRDGRKFLLTNLLLRRLIATAPARIVIVSCGVHDAAQRTGMPKPAMTDIPTLVATGGPRAGEYDGRRAYVNCKFSNMWFVYELVRRIVSTHIAQGEKTLSVNGFDPGLRQARASRAVQRVRQFDGWREFVVQQQDACVTDTERWIACALQWLRVRVVCSQSHDALVCWCYSTRAE